MGCVSSKLVAKEIKEERNRDYAHHVVSLTSSTYGVLNLEKEREIRAEECGMKVKKTQIRAEDKEECVVKVVNSLPREEAPPRIVDMEKERGIRAEEKEDECVVEVKRSQVRAEEKEDECVVKVKLANSEKDETPEIINAWELMEGLDEEVCVVVQSKKSSPIPSPLKLFSPRKGKKSGSGKENKGRISCSSNVISSPNSVLKECNNLKKPSPKLWASIKAASPKCESLRFNFDSSTRMKRRSLGPLFDPENILESYERKCPPGGEDAVVIYTTTLRGIRKTFEECNVVRSIVESQGVEVFERDISMHSGFREELRGLMGRVKVPVVFVRGRLIGGAEEMVKLDEEGKLAALLRGIAKAEARACAGCGGVRFVMCGECSGSCKVVGEDGKKSEKCRKCNENGLVQCPMCCCLITM